MPIIVQARLFDGINLTPCCGNKVEVYREDGAAGEEHNNDDETELDRPRSGIYNAQLYVREGTSATGTSGKERGSDLSPLPHPPQPNGEEQRPNGAFKEEIYESGRCKCIGVYVQGHGE